MDIINKLRRLLPTYDPDKHVITPPDKPTKTKPLSGQYDYENLDIVGKTGLLRHAFVEQDGILVHESDMVAPDTDNGRRQSRLTPEDMSCLARRGLDADKAAYTKPYWAAGFSTEGASRTIKSKTNGQRGYGKRTLDEYWAAFTEALPYSSREAPPPV